MSWKTVRAVLFAAAALGSAPRAAWGWGDLGHQAVAEIAEQRLDENGKALIYSILGADPLAYAAIFPDVVRSDARYKEYGEKGFADYHLFEVPFGKTVAEMTPELRKPRDALVILEMAPSILLQKPDLPAGITEAEKVRRIEDLRNLKILMLRYLVHVVGDVHQPLHVGNGVDRGANTCVVHWVEPWPVLDPKDPDHRKPLLDPKKKEVHQVRVENLHTVWDERLIDYLEHEFTNEPPSGKAPKKRYFGYPELVQIVLADFASDKAKADLEAAGRQKPVEWLAEAQALHAQIYPDAKPVKDPKDRPYCKSDPTQIPLLDEAYAKRSLPLLKSQIAKGGARLVAILNDVGAQAMKQGLITRDLATADARFLETARVSNPLSQSAPTSSRPSSPPSSSTGPASASSTAASATGVSSTGQGSASGNSGCSTYPGAPSAGFLAGLGSALLAGVQRLRRRRAGLRSPS